jgi:hypothetical protein
VEQTERQYLDLVSADLTVYSIVVAVAWYAIKFRLFSKICGSFSVQAVLPSCDSSTLQVLKPQDSLVGNEHAISFLLFIVSVR